MDIQQNILLKDWTFWRIGGPAEFFCLPKSVGEVRDAVEFARTRNLEITVLGGGTNVLISDAGIKGLVICMQELSEVTAVENEGRIQLTALAGTPKSELTKIFLKHKLAPALFLCGLPGDVGGGVVMNAGVAEQVTPREFVEITDWVDYLDLNSLTVKQVRKDELQWRYRASVGWQPGIIVRVGLSWVMRTDPDIPLKVKDATKNRLNKQPLNMPSCGSTFKNPLPQTAGSLIDLTGLKGFQIGGAQVSPKHANFIVNVGDATAADVKGVINHVRNEVRKKFGIELETEVKFLGGS